jgi:nucleoside phosphorylase
VVSLPAGDYGLAPAATIAQALRSSLPRIRIGLLVGIGAGVPGESINRDAVRRDIRLGDVVVSEPSGTSGGVVQMDLFEISETDGKLAPRRIGSLDRPPMALRTALSKMKARHERKGSSVPSITERAMRENVKMQTPFAHPGLKSLAPTRDLYYLSSGEFVERGCREEPTIHYGVIGSSNQLIKTAAHRDQLVEWLIADGHDPLCLEMEAAGLMNSFPCLVIRGICDYADKHKNDDWQRYAAVAAAALAKDYLNSVQPDEVQQEAPLSKVLQSRK